MIRVGVDTGGTFTDLVLARNGELVGIKVLSTRRDPSEAVAIGLGELLSRTQTAPSQVTHLAHGTTVATNAMLEGRWAKAAMLTTRGFRDLLEIGDQRRPNLYDAFFEKARIPIEREFRAEITERLSVDGELLDDLDLDEALEQTRRFVEQGVQSLAICFLHAYINDDHEVQVRDAIKAEFPDLDVWTSSEVLAEYRELDRFSTTVIDAVLGPVMSRYLGQLSERCRGVGVSAQISVMQSNGGVGTVDEVARASGRTLLSGPAAGVLGAIHVAKAAGVKDLLTLDMGGTSADISLVRSAEPTYTQRRHVEGLPLRRTTMDISAIGAGGGSIAWVDTGGRLNVGPQSAGSEPGPAAYGLGGERPTVTDANLVAGRLPLDVRLGERVALDIKAAHEALRTGVAEPLGLSVTEAALAVLQVVNTKMALAARLALVSRGQDPRDYTLVAYGGAGPMQAVEVARELDIPEVLVPPGSGMLCALGLLVSDLRREFTRTELLTLAPAGLDRANAGWLLLGREAEEWIAKQETETPAEPVISFQIDARYKGQHHELAVDVPRPDWTEKTLEVIEASFVERHERDYGFAAKDEPIEIVSLRVIVVFPSGADADVTIHSPVDRRDPREETRVQKGYWAVGSPAADTAVLDRESLEAGQSLAGPAIIEQQDSTTAVPPGAVARVDKAGNLRIKTDVDKPMTVLEKE